MPYAIAQWTAQQWGVFVTVIAAGLLAMLLAPVVVRTRADVRASRRGRHVAPRHLAAAYPARALPVVPGAGDLPQAAQMINEIEAHLAAGPGSLATLREVGPGVIERVEPLVDADVHDELGAGIDAALEAFRIGMEPVMRTARLWMLRGGETYAENALRRWHIEEVTGEILPEAVRSIRGTGA